MIGNRQEGGNISMVGPSVVPGHIANCRIGASSTGRVRRTLWNAAELEFGGVSSGSAFQARRLQGLVV